MMIYLTILDMNDKLETEASFHQYVEPIVHKQLTAFCSKVMWSIIISSSSINYPCEFSPLAGVGQPFTTLLLQPSLSPAFCCTIPFFFMSSSPMSIHRFTGLPLFLHPSIFNSNTFLISTSSSLKYVWTTSIFSASSAPLDRSLPLLMQSLYSQPYPSMSLRRSF